MPMQGQVEALRVMRLLQEVVQVKALSVLFLVMMLEEVMLVASLSLFTSPSTPTTRPCGACLTQNISKARAGDPDRLSRGERTNWGGNLPVARFLFRLARHGQVRSTGGGYSTRAGAARSESGVSPLLEYPTRWNIPRLARLVGEGVGRQSLLPVRGRGREAPAGGGHVAGARDGGASGDEPPLAEGARAGVLRSAEWALVVTLRSCVWSRYAHTL